MTQTYTLIATPIEHTDVRNKKTYWVKITSGTEELIIKIGIKNYNALKAMTKQTKLKL